MKTKRFLCVFFAVMMLFSIIPFSAIQAYAATISVDVTGVYTGTGTESDPYVVSNATDLYGLIHSDMNMYIKLGQDITITSTIYVESNITIDVNGKTLTMDASDYGINIEQGCSLKIKGSGKFVQKGTKLWAMFFVEGTLETRGTITYECPKESGNPICMSRYGVARIYGGNFVGDQISINGGAKVYVYGGTISTNVLITKATQLYVYGGTFEKRVYNYGYFVSFGGEFLEDVSSITTTGEAILYGGHFEGGVGKYSTSETGGSHSLGLNALCYCKKLNTVADNAVYLATDITVFSPNFAEQTPELKLGQTELDLGTINSLEDYYVSFKAKDVPAGFVELGYTIEEKIIVKDSDGFTQDYDIKSGTKGQGVKLNLGNLTGGDYTVERIINLYKGPSIVKTNKTILKVTVNPMDESLFGFASMKPVVSSEDKTAKYTELGEIPIETQTLTFGFTPYISAELSSKGCKVTSKVYINYENQGTLATRNTGADFNLMNYVNKTGDYQVWFTINLYRDNEYVTSISHIYNVKIVPIAVNTLKANVTAPVDGALPNATVTPAGEGYKTTDVDWSYYNETYGDYYIMPDGMTFEAGKTYECAVQFEVLNSEYTFADDKAYMAGYINGYKGVISSVYSNKKAYVTVQFTVPAKEKLEVIFTPDSKPQADSKLTVDIEAMAELDDELMEAYLNGDVVYKWFYDGRLKLTTQSNVYEIQKSMIGHYIAVKVVYGDKSVVSEEFQIEEAKNTGLLGDATEDGIINIMDATIVQKYLAGLQELTASQLRLADVDGSGIVDIKDATAIQKYLAGLDIGYAIGKPI